MPDIKLTHEQAIEAVRLFSEGISQGFAHDRDGDVPLSKAIDVLQTAFETIVEGGGSSAKAIPIDQLNASNDE
jgi:hypothetical protein